jgi:hypothetical protein
LAPSLEDLGVLMIFGENHFFKNFFSNGFNIIVKDVYSRVELCMPTWLIHDYGDGVVEYIGGGRIFWNGVMHTNIFM